MGQVQKKELIKIDPRTKLLFILSAGGIIIGTIPIWAELVIFLAALFLCLDEKMYFTAFKFTVGFFVLLVIESIIKASGNVNTVTTVLLLCSSVFRKFIPAFMSGEVFVATTTISEIMAAAEKMKIPYKWVIPLAVIVRFFPTLKEEWKNIKMAMKMRDIGISLEYILVPLLSSSVRIGEELSAASLTRGLGAVRKRTNICAISLKVQDYILMTALVAFGVFTYGNFL